MALHHSPKIVTDGLVFYYDKANTKKSWIGAPTTNLAMTSSSVTDWSIGNLEASVSRGTITANEKYSITSTTGGAFRMYFNASNLVNAETYNLSFNFSLESGGPDFYASDWCDVSVAGTRTTTSNGDGTFFHTAYGSRATYDGTYRFMDIVISANTVIHIWDVQLEESAYYTPYTSYQRTNTQAIVDLTGTNTITANSLTYTQDDFTFNSASSNYITIPPANVPSGTEQSVELWNNGPHGSGSVAIQGTNAIGGRTLNVHLTWGAGIIYYDSGGANGTTLYNRINKTISSGDFAGWHHWVFTKNQVTGNMKIYKDGAEWHSGVGMTYVIGDCTSFRIGSAVDAAVYHDGDLDIVKLYNKELTAAEVLQNFNATRARFGI